MYGLLKASTVCLAHGPTPDEQRMGAIFSEEMMIGWHFFKFGFARQRLRYLCSSVTDSVWPWSPKEQESLLAPIVVHLSLVLQHEAHVSLDESIATAGDVK